MTEALTLVPPALVVLAAALGAATLSRRTGHALGATATLFVLVAAIVAPEGQHVAVEFLGFDVVFFNVDSLSRLIAIAIGLLGTAAVVYAYGSRAPRAMTGFALAYVASTTGAVFAGDWLTLLLWWELMAVTSTLLVWHHGGRAVRAGYRYAIAHGIGGSLLLFAVGWHIAAGGGLSLAGGIAVEGTTTLTIAGVEASVPAVLAALGIGVNCGFIGLHTWLPDTYPRPHIAASVFLSVFTTKTGAYVLFRAFPEGGMFLAYMGGAMAVYGVIFALLQHDMRALLSYHIMAQVGYMTAGIGLIGASGFPELAAAGAMAHVFNNILFKALLFMAVGVVIYRTGVGNLYELGGLWRKMPITAAGFGLGALSITAIPGFNGFISKGMLLDVADPGYYGTAATEPIYWMLLLGAIGTFLSFIKLGYYAFLHGEFEGTVEDATAGQAVAMLSVGGLCVLFGTWWPALIGLVPGVAATELTPYSLGHLTDAVVLATLSVVVFALVKKPLSKVGHVPDAELVIDPLVFYGGRAGTFGVTDTYAAIDRAGIRLANAAMAAPAQPSDVVVRVRGLTGGTSENEPSVPSALRTDIGTSTLFVVAVLTALLFAVYWL